MGKANATITATEALQGKTESVTIDYDSSSPFIYSVDENGNLELQHQPLPYKLVKTVEGTNYGTMRLLQDQNGIYYIQIVE